ncbi:MAG: XRE family transcriptional regulator [Gammaproteobacteria bacterium]|nr:MAG: XRE family transcriptional regulator [Gammaproteobacteria bacterium]
MFLELRHLRLLAALRDGGSLAAAARRLNQTQSALSHQIKALEARLGGPVYLRRSRPLRFTASGRRLLDLADQVLPAVAAAERALLDGPPAPPASLHLTLECHSCFDWLLPVMDEFRRHWGERVELDLSVAHAFDPLPALSRGQVDLVIGGEARPLPGLHYAPLFRHAVLLALPPRHPLADKDWIEPADLAAATLITYPVPRARLDVFSRFLDPAGVEPAALRSAELTAVILQLVAAGRGVAALPAWTLREHLASGHIAARPLGREGLWSTVWAAVREADRDLAHVADFIAAARRTALARLPEVRPVGPTEAAP